MTNSRAGDPEVKHQDEEMTETIDQIRELQALRAENIRLRLENIRLQEEQIKSLQSADVLETLFDQSISVMGILDRNYNFIKSNGFFGSMYSQRPAEFSGHSFFEFYPFPAIRDIFDQIKVNKEKMSFVSMPWPARDDIQRIGTYWDCSITPVLDAAGEVDLLILNAYDVTEHVRLKAQHEENEVRYHTIFENDFDAIILCLPDGTILSGNPAACRMFDRDPAEMGTLCHQDLVDPEDARMMAAQREREISGKSHSEMIFVRKDGSRFIGDVTACSFQGHAGNGYYYLNIRDITSRKTAEENLRLSEELFKKTFNTNPLPMAILSTQSGAVIEINETFRAQDREHAQLMESGLSSQKLLNHLCVQTEFMDRVCREGSVRNYEIDSCKESGEKATYLISGVVINWLGEECILITANDISQLRQYQNEMIRLSRLNLVGEMSAGIAHEIRNPMTTVRGFLQLFQSKSRYAEDMADLNLMIDELDRANVIITDFLSLAKGKVIHLSSGNLNEKIKMLAPILEANALMRDVSIKLDLEDLPDILLDAAEIRQLVLNLMQNGFDVTPPGGELTIRTYCDDNGITMAIQDQGPGIPASALEKIGTPFFTTKESGTGLGLAICYSIANRHQARIEVDTSASGTVFKVIFPATA